MPQRIRNASTEALNKPKSMQNHSSYESGGEGAVSNTSGSSSSENTEKEKSEGSEGKVLKSRTPNNSNLDIEGPASQDVEIESREV